MVGAGATGGYIGARLAQAGRDVTFLVREGRAQTLRQRGLRLVLDGGGPAGPEGAPKVETVVPALMTAAELREPFDVVVLTVKATALHAAITDMAPAVGPDTVIIPFLNGMAHMDALATAFGAGKVLGSTVQLITTVTPDGDIEVLMPLARWAIGEQHGEVSSRVRDILAVIDVPGFEATAVRDALAAMWHKWVFIVTAGVVTCLMRGPAGAIVAVPGGLEFVYAALAEAVAVSTEAGFPVPEKQLGMALRLLTEPGSTFTSSLYRDMSAGLPNEGEHLLGDFTRRARELGLETPLIDLALMHLRVHEAQTGLDG